MTPKLFNSLLFYMRSIHESAELAESESINYKNKFEKLGKYDQMEIDMSIGLDGWERGITLIDKYANA